MSIWDFPRIEREREAMLSSLLERVLFFWVNPKLLFDREEEGEDDGKGGEEMSGGGGEDRPVETTKGTIFFWDRSDLTVSPELSVDLEHWLERKKDGVHVIGLQIISQGCTSVGGLNDGLGSRRALVDASHEERRQFVWMHREHPVEVILTDREWGGGMSQEGKRRDWPRLGSIDL
jgi:hypothetical protein